MLFWHCVYFVYCLYFLFCLLSCIFQHEPMWLALYSLIVLIQESTHSLLVRRKYHHFSDKVEMEYRLFLAIDMSLYRHKKIISGGCAKFHPLAFYPRDAMLARVIVITTCLSDRLSVTRRYCVKTKKAGGMISSPSGSPKTLVFWRQISSPNSKGFSPNGGLKEGSVGKIQRFSSFKRQYLENGSRYGQSYY